MSSIGSIALLALSGLGTPRAEAQFGRGDRTPNATLKSTEVADDHKVTFRIYAPKATEVSVSGDFGGGKLSKDDKGVWSITVGPLTPDFYSYSFVVDGVRTLDPKNAVVKPGIASVSSMFLVPGDDADSKPRRTSLTARSTSGGITQARSTRYGACTFIRHQVTRGVATSTRFSTCCMARRRRCRLEHRWAAPDLYSTI